MKKPKTWRSRLLSSALILAAGAVPSHGLDSDIPDNLVVDVRLFEARSTRPDFQTMGSLAFFVDTDGSGVSEQQWLATIARKISDSFLTTLARETIEVDGKTARFELQKRTRSFGVTVDLANFLDRGTFTAKARVELARSGNSLRELEREIELRVGQTYVWADRELEISASDYISHFRDYDDTDHRADLYGKLREYTIFLVLAVTPRLAPTREDPPPVEIQVEEGMVPELESPLGIRLVGELVLGLLLDDTGRPSEIEILRSSIPEVNPRILGEASLWSFPDAGGKHAVIRLSLRAEP